MSFERLLRLLAADGFHHAKSLVDKSVDVSPIPHIRRHSNHMNTSWDRCRLYRVPSPDNKKICTVFVLYSLSSDRNINSFAMVITF